jgi:integrase/recombinase XerD
MLTLYRRHKRDCPHRHEGRTYRRCRCPLWVDGVLNGEEVRWSLGVRGWEQAQIVVREWEARGREPVAIEPEPVTVEHAWEQFLADAEAQKLHEDTIGKYRLLSRQMKEFAGRLGLRFLCECDLNMLSKFRMEWRQGPSTAGKKLERLRAFLGFAQRRGWIETNPARELKAPRVAQCPTLPFTYDEMVRVLSALDIYAEQTSNNGKVNAVRLRALVLLLRYSGLRIGDAVALTVDRLSGNRLFLRTAKTGTPVNSVLPDFVMRVLGSTPRMTEKYFFWTGIGKLNTAVRVWETRLRRLFDLAKLPGGRAHRFRDTFAVELLLAGVPLERVSVLLGHQSIRITEKHYAPWVRSRQEQLERDLESAWSRDPLVLLETKGTPEVHGKTETVN